MKEADDGTRTRDLLITNQLLYQLSYVGKRAVAGSGGKTTGAAARAQAKTDQNRKQNPAASELSAARGKTGLCPGFCTGDSIPPGRRPKTFPRFPAAAAPRWVVGAFP